MQASGLELCRDKAEILTRPCPMASDFCYARHSCFAVSVQCPLSR